jgi:cytochrome c biogenesis protein CcdA
VAACIDIVLGVGLLIWGVVRLRRPETRPPKPSTPRGLGLISLAGTGIVFAIAAIADPTFVSLVVIAGRAEHYESILAAHSTWTLVSHTPLVLVLTFALIGQNERVVNWVRSLWGRISPLMDRLITVAVFVAGVFLLLDALWWFTTGRFFIPV